MKRTSQPESHKRSDQVINKWPGFMKSIPPSRLFSLLAAFVSCAVLAGCGLVKSKEDADKVLLKHFQTISTNGYEAALADYSPQFFQSTTREQWSKALARLSATLGTYQSHRITSWRTFTRAGTSGAGTTVTLQCQVIYSKHAAQETFTLFKGFTDSDYKIIRHQIDGAALLME